MAMELLAPEPFIVNITTFHSHENETRREHRSDVSALYVLIYIQLLTTTTGN